MKNNTEKKNKPEPLRPVIHITQPFWLSKFCLSILSIEHSCHFIFVEFPILDNGLWFFPVHSIFKFFVSIRNWFSLKKKAENGNLKSFSTKFI